MSDPKVVAVRKDASEARIRANRENCLKSTGPKSAEGKAKSSQNAVFHGFFSRQVVLEGENQQEFDRLRNGLFAEHQPRSVTEQFLVERMAVSMWKLNRMQAIERQAYEDRAESIRERVSTANAPRQCSTPSVALWLFYSAAGQSVLEKVEMYEKRLEGTFHRSARELRKMREAESDGTKPISEEVDAGEGSQDHSGEMVVSECMVSGDQPGEGSGELELASRGAFSPSPQPSPAGGEGAG